MKYLFIFILTSLPLLANTVPIKKITIFKDRAYVLRQLETTVEAGVHQLEFNFLPHDINIDEVKLTVNNVNLVEILGLDQEQIHFENFGNESLNLLIEKEKKLQQEINAIIFEGQKIIKMDKNIEDLLQHYRESFAWNLNTSVWTADGFQKFILFVVNQNNKIYQSWGQLYDKLREKQKLKDDLLAQITVLKKGTQQSYLKLKVTIKAIAKNNLKLGLQYLVSSVKWIPTYDLRVSSTTKSAILEMFANITQNTGENWENVQLLINQSPAPLKTTIPALAPNYLTYQEVEDVQTTASNVMENNENIGTGDKDLLQDKEVSEMVVQIPGLHTIKNHTANNRVFLGKKNVNYQDLLELIGPQQHYVYRLGEFTNPFPYGLLPGQWSIYRDQQFLQKTLLPFVPIGKNFYLNLGIEYGIYVQRIVSDHSEQQGMIEKETVYQREINYKIKNNTATPHKIRVLEQMPTSQLQTVKVTAEDGPVKFLPLPNFESWYFYQIDLTKGGEQDFGFKMKVVTPVDFQFRFP